MGQDALTLQKAEAFAHIATAIAATGFVDASIFDKQESVSKPIEEKPETPTKKASLERKPEPKKVVGTAKVEVPVPPAPAPAWLNSQEFAELKELGKEPEDKHAERMNYLLETYGSKQMKELPAETFNYFHLEIREMKLMKYYLGTWNADPDRWRIKAATEISNNRTTEINELTVEEYLKKLIPAIGHLNYLLSFTPDQRAELMDVINEVSNHSVKKLEDLRFQTVAFIRIGVDKKIDGTFDDVEKVS